MSSSAVSPVVRGSALIILSVGHCQLPMAATVFLIFKALISFAKLLEPLLHYVFISRSEAKCTVDVASCLHCFTTPFELE